MNEVHDRGIAVTALRHAIPYIRMYKGRTFVIKTGGAVLTDPGKTRALLEQVGVLHQVGIRTVLVHGGVAGNVIPDEAVLTINYRFAPSRTIDEAAAKVRALFPDFELEITDAADGARPGLDDPLAQQFVQAVGAEAKPKYGWTDVARFSVNDRLPIARSSDSPTVRVAISVEPQRYRASCSRAARAVKALAGSNSYVPPSAINDRKRWPSRITYDRMFGHCLTS